MDTELTRPSYRELTRFFLPLVVISFSQTFTYPLVASVISNGPLGGLEYEAYVIGNQVVNFLSSFGFSLITTGIVFATTQTARRNFNRLIVLVTATTVLLQLAASLPLLENLVFGRILAVDNPELRRIARRSILACIPVQVSFSIRNAWTAHLFRSKRSDLANAATLFRVALAVLLSPCFVRFGLVGYAWGAVAMTLPCFVETAVSWWFARPYLAALPPADPSGRPASVLRQFCYTMPLSMGAVLMTATAFITTSFFSRSSAPESFRLIHYVAYGLAVSFFASALKLQTVTVVFGKTRAAARRVLLFSLAAGAGLAAMLAAVTFHRSFAQWYFCEFQNIPSNHLEFAISTVFAGAFIAILYGLRGFAEGLAAVRFKTPAVLIGQIAYILAFWGAFAACPRFLAGSDHLWGMAAIAVATAVSASVTYVSSLVIPASVNSAGRNRGGKPVKP
jgi:hypothetical protein